MVFSHFVQIYQNRTIDLKGCVIVFLLSLLLKNDILSIVYGCASRWQNAYLISTHKGI